MEPDTPHNIDEEIKLQSVVALQVIRATCASVFAYMLALALGGGIRPEAAVCYGLAALAFLFLGLRINPQRGKAAAMIYAASLVAFSCFWVSILLLV